MAEIAKSDLFFFITTMAVIVLSITILVLLVYVFIIIRDIKSVVHRVKEESDGVLGDIRDLRLKIKESSGVASYTAAVFSFLKKAFFVKRSRSKKHKERVSDEE
jgi:formate-dependent nitrite reductase membrane component NrfD